MGRRNPSRSGKHCIVSSDEDQSGSEVKLHSGTSTPDRLRDLDAKVAKAIGKSKSKATRDAYEADFEDFTHWCKKENLIPMPAASIDVARYLSDLAFPDDDRKPLTVSTIQRRIASIGAAHKQRSYPNPCDNEGVREAMKGIRRHLGTKQRRKSGLSTAEIRAIVETIDGSELIGIRDRALLLLGFATALRRSELVALEVGDLERHPEGLVVWKRRSKTDQEGAGAAIEVAYGEHLITCPVRATRAWLDEAAIEDGPVFRSVDRHGNISEEALSSKSVAGIVKKHAQRLGHDPDDFAGHSLRRGFSTEAARNGAPERVIATTTHHTTVRGLKPYIEEADRFTDPPSRYLGL